MVERSDFILQLSGEFFVYFGAHVQKEVVVSHKAGTPAS